MSQSHPRPRLLPGLTAAAAALALALGGLTTASAAPAAPAQAPASPAPGRYIVTLKGRPIATYDGAVPGLRATRPTPGRRVDVGSARARQYRAYLQRRQTDVAARVGARPLHHFSVSLNGFTASLSPDQARALRRAPGVLAVTKDVPRHFTGDENSADFLRLTGDGGVWDRLGGPAKAGRGVVVGILDSGYWPENASFAGDRLGTAKPPASDPYRPYRVGRKIVMKKADGSTFSGTCQAGASFTGQECNTKVVGARYFSGVYESQTSPADRTDYLSPRDGDGHGSHTASTAAGNAEVPASIGSYSYGTVSGVAPGAKLAIYKVGFTSTSTEGEAVIYSGDAISAVDAAITDGVDVINYSVGGSDRVDDPVDLAFLSAASAGIFVATSAGNDGPGASTLNHVVPWLTTVAASTVAPRAGTVELGDGRKYAGISTTVNAPVGRAPLVAAAAVKLSGAAAADASLCAAETLDPAKVAGKIVVCDRGVVARVEKSAEVQRAGGVGMVLANLTENSTDGDTHAVPTVHLDSPAGPAVKAYAQNPGATARLVPGNTTTTTIPYPQVAGFSSRGPSIATQGDVLKPDLAAPGVAILAAVAPPTNEGRSFDFLSGTSMASPHVAGLAALYFGVHPRWSPMAVKSALMTTTSRVRNADGTVSRDYYAQGAGNVRPDRMFDPGVIFDAGDEDWLGFLEGSGFDTRTGTDAVDPSDANAASIAVGDLGGSQTVTRRVTALQPGLFRASTSVPGVIATVSPSILNFTAAGQTKTIRVTFTRRTAPLDDTVFGSLYLRGAGVQARVPVAVVPRALAAPAVVRGTGTSGSVEFDVQPGFNGAFPIKARGLDTGDAQRGSVSEADGEPAEFPATVSPGTKVLRFSAESDASGADIDLYVYRVVDGEQQEVGVSAGDTGKESVTLLDPEPGQYLALVAPFDDASGTSATAFTFRSVTVGAQRGNFSVAPASVQARVGDPITVTATWSGLAPNHPYLGFVEYVDGSGTLVEVN